MADDWQLAARARLNFADMVEELTDEQLDAKSLAGHWTPRHVLGHVVFIIEMKMPAFMLAMAKAGFNYDKMADTTAKANAQRPMSELLSVVRTRAAQKAPVPTFTEMIPVGDVAIHTQDVRRALDLPGQLDLEVLRTALDFVTTHKIGKDLADLPKRDNVKLAPTDLEWTYGTGPEVVGTGEAILMTLAGRLGGEELSGDGVALLLS